MERAVISWAEARETVSSSLKSPMSAGMTGAGGSTATCDGVLQSIRNNKYEEGFS